MMRGALIVVEGLDRAGKSSQCEILRDNLQKSGRSVKYVRFPDRTTPIGRLIDGYLRGQSQLDDHSVHLLFSANRWEVAQSIEQDIANGVTVIVDRYSYSGAVYSAAKANPNLSLNWAWQPEIGLPRPDLCLFLRISPDEAAKRGGFGAERYENETMQRRVRELFQTIFDLQPSGDVHIIDAEGSIEDVSQGIRKIVVNCIERLHTIGALRKLGPIPI
ncbi:Thymidylate kinase [Aspergillus nanangensis]|uniref:Thymidylate kinase n=1 Tax=Aspergillus nanangensis TaxID=2582783 RepID=A0AAD4GP13_ASPNN|nr:Thymidylate kinase [Aspergillus nanangensis]